MFEAIGRRRLGTDCVADVTGVDPGLGQSRGEQRPNREGAGDPGHPVVEIGVIEDGAQFVDAGTPPCVDPGGRRVADALLRIAGALKVSITRFFPGL